MAYEEIKAKIPQEGFKCKKLCGKCCTNMAPVTRSEAEEICAWIKKNVDDKDLVAQFQHYDTDPGACPFLRPDKTCFIYPVRPVVCHTFGHLEETPLADKRSSQKCPEGVNFIEVKFIELAKVIDPYMEELEHQSIRTIDFRSAHVAWGDGTEGKIPVTPGSAYEKLLATRACMRCQKPFSDNKAYLEGAELLCYECGG
jgi:Fe-S-cluster containining protein